MPFVIEHVITLSDDTKHFLGQLMATTVRPLLAGQDTLEQKMTEISDFLDAENNSISAIASTLTTVAADVTALLATASSAGAFSADDQVKADAATSGLASLASAAAALQGQLEPAPVDAPPADGGDTPPVDEPAAS